MIKEFSTWRKVKGSNGNYNRVMVVNVSEKSVSYTILVENKSFGISGLEKHHFLRSYHPEDKRDHIKWKLKG
jgi:hypothetical protein